MASEQTDTGRAAPALTRAGGWRVKPVEAFEAQAQAGPKLQRSLGLVRLTLLGVGATIGTGIFVALTSAVPKAGPAVILAFLIAGAVAALTALCYAELASTLPVSGSAYSYAYATLGEVTAFVVAACLLLEYGVSAAAIAVGWGQYLNELLAGTVGWRIPAALVLPPERGGVFNLPAVVLVGLCVLLLRRGVRESATVNAVLVLVKVAVLIFFVALASKGFSARHFHPFLPHHWAGVGAAAGSVFFSYIGIDTVSTAGEETKDPRRTLPKAIVLSLLIVTCAYVLVAVAAVGAQPWTEFSGQEAGLAVILRNVTGAAWPAVVLSLGATVSIFSITLVVIYGQTRILYAMSRDGLLPGFFARVDADGQGLRGNTLVVGAGIALLAAFVPLDVLVDLTSLGALVAFMAVSAGVIALRRRRPDLPRGFSVPLYPFLPIVSILACLYLVTDLPRVTLKLFAEWASVALVFYFLWARKRSQVGRLEVVGPG